MGVEQPVQQSVLAEGDNIWCLTKADEATFLIDAEQYFAELFHALQQAEKQVLILGWDIHSGMILCPGARPEEGGIKLHELINNIAKSKPKLEIFILTWDFTNLIFSMEREALQSIKFGWMSEQNIHFLFDSEFPVGGSHHQKIVVIDDQLAFCGGLDLTVSRWDTGRHEPDDKRRVLPNGKAYQPFHDVQMAVTGEAAHKLGELARWRWLNASQSKIPAPDVSRKISWSGQVVAELQIKNARLGISRTIPGYRLQKESREVQKLYLDMIQSARNYIYIENQYLTSQKIVEGLLAALAKNQPPEIVIVLPKRAGGWLEEKTLGLIQSSAVSQLKSGDRHGKLAILYPEDRRLSGDQYITVHSKVMIVDDVMARVGSSNLNHRSMGLDTECDLLIDGSFDQSAQVTIRQFLVHLLADHWGVETQQVAKLMQGSSLLVVQEKLRELSTHKTLEQMPVDENSAKIGKSMAEAELLDMESRSPIEESLDHWAYISESVGKKEVFLKRNMGIIITSFIAIIFAFGAVFLPVSDYLEPLLSSDQTGFLGIPFDITAIIIGIYALSGMILIPLNLLIIITATIFPFWEALAMILIGSVVSAASGYALGRLLKSRVPRQFLGGKSEKVIKRIRKGGFMSLLFVRLVPVAPHAIVNITAGISRFQCQTFLLATLLGTLPGAVVLVSFQRSLIDLLSNFSIADSIIFAGILAILISVLYLLRTRFSRYVERKA